MLHSYRILLGISFSILLIQPIVKAEGKQSEPQSVPEDFMNYFDPSHATSRPEGAQPEHAALQGTVREHMDAKEYTYLKMEVGGKLMWIAGYKVDVADGDSVEFVPNHLMENFHSKTLDRDFDKIYFVENLRVKSSGTSIPAANKPDANKPKIGKPPEKNPPTGSLLELISKRQSFVGKTRTVQGTVVKVNANILNKNWIHVTDSSLSKEDFVVTSADCVNVGDKITATGMISIDKDFSAGYVFPVIMEDAQIVRQLTADGKKATTTPSCEPKPL